ncbi:MAG: GAF domain-containing protein [Acidimicrobiia bacterium]
MLLIAIPTYFAVFPRETAAYAFGIRIAIGVVWAGIAVLAVLSTTRSEQQRDASLDRLTADQERQQRDRITRIALPLFELLGAGTFGFPKGYAFTIYCEDETGERLVPLWPYDPTVESVCSFEPGKGATGKAWSTRETAVVTGTAVSDDTHELTGEQQTFFAPYRSVVATPIFSGARPLGVLTAISRTNDGFFDDSEARERLRDLATLLGPVMVALVSQ